MLLPDTPAALLRHPVREDEEEEGGNTGTIQQAGGGTATNEQQKQQQQKKHQQQKQQREQQKQQPEIPGEAELLPFFFSCKNVKKFTFNTAKIIYLLVLF